ncbi:hypothetical protein PIB30_000528 [Stylosanthes scabra]|uniref:Uncharacterized protein n=1 Tax=Stylosanthes scabra TaxID=79078 RepID=A0ABU6W0J0_9FABA|nr:hypothetical protein [Stylosanthes scabra]
MHSSILKHASDVYTHKLYKLIEKEYLDGTCACDINEVEANDLLYKFECRMQVRRGKRVENGVTGAEGSGERLKHGEDTGVAGGRNKGESVEWFASGVSEGGHGGINSKRSGSKSILPR